MKQLIIAVIAIVGIVGAAVAFGGSEEVVAAPSNNFYGQEEGVIEIVEYGDFECPACAGFFPIVTQVKEQFADQVRFTFRHFPLVQIHPNATAAHRAAQAAANQGQFWEMHDLLFQRQSQWRSQGGSAGHSGVPISNNNPTSIFEEYARELGLDMEQYTADAATSETLGIINADVAVGKDKGYSGTPTFEIDGVVVEDTNTIASVELFAAVIQAAIDAKNGVETEEPAADDTATEPESAETETTEEDTTSGQ